MKRKLISVLVAGLFVPALAQGQEPQREVSASVTLGLRQTGINANDPSKFREYRDIEPDTQLFGGFEMRSRSPRDYFNAYGENIGHDDQYVDANGGRYGAWKYRIYSDSLRHNFGSGPGARTPFIGAGSSAMVGLPNLNVVGWNTFNHSYKRVNAGGMFELQATSPWYFRFDANEVKRNGTNVFAGAKGTSPGNGFADLPVPIDYTAKNLSGEVGWSSKTAHFAVNYLHSDFDNGNSVLRWSNDYFGLSQFDTTVLPPSNQLNRFGLNGNIRGLPLNSTLAGRFTYTTLTNDVTMQTQMLDVIRTGPVFNQFNATNPSDPSYKGDHKTTTASLSYASQPSQALDTKVYWNYLKMKNDSTRIEFNPAPDTGLRVGSNNPIVGCNRGLVAVPLNPTGVANPCEPELFHYKKQNIGAEAGYRLSRENRLRAGLDYTHTDRERADFVKTKEARVFGEWKNSSLDWATGRVKYTFTDRRSDFEAKPEVLAANPMDLFVRRFDQSNAHMHQLKFAGDANVGNGFDLGAEVILKKIDYLDAPLGRTGDDRQEYYLSVGWGDPSSFRVMTFGDIEYSTYESRHRVGAGNPDPASGNSNTTYNWRAKNQDTSWQVGIGADWAPRTRFKIKSSAIYAQTNGEADFASEQTGAPLAVTTPVRNFDNTRRIAFTLRGVYEYTRNIELGAGYAYEKYRYSDIGYDNTRYVVGTSTATSANTNAYTTGQFAFQNYSVNVVFATAKYKF